MEAIALVASVKYQAYKGLSYAEVFSYPFVYFFHTLFPLQYLMFFLKGHLQIMPKLIFENVITLKQKIYTSVY